MPWHVHPKLRALEEHLESKGMIKTMDSRGVTIIKAEEAGGKRIKQVPKAKIWHLGSVTTPS